MTSLKANVVLRTMSLRFAQLFLINWLRTCTRKKGKADLTWWKNRLQRRAKRDSTAEKLEPPSPLIIGGGGERKVSQNGKLYLNLWIFLSPSCSGAVEKKVNGDADAAEDSEDDGDGHPMISDPSSPPNSSASRSAQEGVRNEEKSRSDCNNEQIRLCRLSSSRERERERETH